MKIVLFANTDWYLYNFRRSLAVALRDLGHEVLLVSPAGDHVQRLQGLGFRWIEAPLVRRGLNPWQEYASCRWLQRLLVREQVDLIHSFTIKATIHGSLAALRGRRVTGERPARVNAVAGLGFVFASDTWLARGLRPVVRGLLRVALGGDDARLILQNPDDMALLTQGGIVSAQQARLIPGSGVDCVRFHPAGDRNAPSDNGVLRVLLAARLLWAKGIADFIAAARTLQAEGRGIEFLLAGEPDAGNPDAVPEHSVRAWVDEGSINWLGHVDDMAALLRTVDIVVLPTRYGEGVPRSLVEAAASGLALVATDAPGCREIIAHEVDGLLVPPGDAGALTAAIVRLQEDPGLRERLGAAARRKAVTIFDEESVIRRTIDVYAELCPAVRNGAD